MFKHILLPTDGSPLSEAAMRKGIQFAKTINARVTGFCVVPRLRHFGYDSDIGPEFKKQAAAAVQAEVAKTSSRSKRRPKKRAYRAKPPRKEAISPMKP